MGDKYKDCRSWEEEIFWTHFQSINFSQFLRGDFLQRLEVPEKFTKNIKKKLPETVTLKGPGGIIWDVGVTEDDDALFFDRGWKNFVKDHSLVENDFLIFKFNGVSNFDVLMFDGRSLCEKASSYFVRKCGHTEFDSGYQTERKMNKNPDEIVYNSPQCGLESRPEKSPKNDIDMRPPREPINSAATNKKMRNVGSSTRSIHARESLGGEELSSFSGEVKVETEFEHTSMDGDVFFPQHASCKRPATQVEKTNVLLMAQEALAEEGFMVLMKPTHVERRFYMSIPTAWVAKHLSKENADVILRINKRTWRTRFNYHRSRNCGGLSGGWRNFVNDNDLQEHDVCVFEPANIGRKPIILDVTIFHVLEAAVPLTQLHPASS
ncbi:B3 domain-containing protein REM16-like [Durio zibethinus]|uniref:B3 domain-containing protein REM16-like n=1 Tax=Durio zibethinus TaxID=66656 RepID=A0A6P6B736_DURZI|nr:B3 domain-containing protein REM16-like [Durio zibethinus]